VESLTKLLAVSTKAADADVVICFAGGDSSSDEMDIAGPDGVTECCSRPLSEVKHGRAWLVLRWGTTLESKDVVSTSGAWISIIEQTAGKD
jgi:hypothetical protein